MSGLKGRPVTVTAEAVLHEAARLFALRGYGNTRMKDIAEAFGVTHAALYYHFKNKQQILLELNESAITGLTTMLADVLQDVRIAGDEKFEAALHGHVRYVAANVLEVASLFEGENELPPDYFESLRQRRRQYTSAMVEMFEAGQASGRYRSGDPRLMVNFVLGTGNWMYRWYREDDRLSPEELADCALQLLTEGFAGPGLS